jgi:hypothetical protein
MTSVTVELEVFDDELEQSIIVTKVFDPLSDNASNDQQSEADEDSTEGAIPLMVAAGGFVLVLLAGIAFALVRSRGRDEDAEASLDLEADVESTVQDSTQGSGLLARAKRLK